MLKALWCCTAECAEMPSLSQSQKKRESFHTSRFSEFKMQWIYCFIVSAMNCSYQFNRKDSLDRLCYHVKYKKIVDWRRNTFQSLWDSSHKFQAED
jgi:hypothetical protein